MPRCILIREAKHCASPLALWEAAFSDGGTWHPRADSPLPTLCEAPFRIQGTFPLGEELRTGPQPLQLIGQRAGKGNVRDTRQKGGRQAS